MKINYLLVIDPDSSFEANESSGNVQITNTNLVDDTAVELDLASMVEYVAQVNCTITYAV